MRNSIVRACIIVAVVLVFAVFLSSCTAKGEAVDPGTWGYERTVIYNALGGFVNAREVRTTYYLDNSYVFEPSGSTGMLVAPSRDGYIMAGWYKAVGERLGEGIEEYAFDGQERWDFYTDRVQDDMTLYARWIPRGKVSYLDADTGAALFEKNITKDSPIQELSASVLALSAPKGMTFEGYYADKEATTPYDFSSYVHVEPTPTQAWLYDRLHEMYPQYLQRIEYEEREIDPESTEDTSWLFLNRLGYGLTPEGEAAIDELTAAKNSLMEENIQSYLVNTAERVVYLKFTDGLYIKVNSAADLKMGASYGFFDKDIAGHDINGYIIESDIDLSGISFTMSESFSGTIEGNGHTLSNLTVSVSSRRLDGVSEKTVGLAEVMDGAQISNLTLKNARLSIQVDSGVSVTGGLLAGKASNVKLTNFVIDGMTVSSGRGDDGKAAYNLGDLFGSHSNVQITDSHAQNLTISISNPESVKTLLFK
ncbi:MAG: InlB B-repeat-containing protein [Christensenellales bacterium]|jgi:uncharacterized repeat protein (TIGR02543 family)